MNLGAQHFRRSLLAGDCRAGSPDPAGIAAAAAGSGDAARHENHRLPAGSYRSEMDTLIP